MTKLIIAVPGINGNSSKFKQLKEFILSKEEYKDAIWEGFNYKGQIWDNQNPDLLAKDLGAIINRRYEENLHDDLEIILVAHSMGTAIIRRAYLNALGISHTNAPNQKWPEKVSRIILMAAISRGIDFKKYTFLKRNIYSLSFYLFNAIGLAKKVRSIRKGSNFLSTLRIDWIRYNNQNIMNPTIIHLLGKEDGIVNETDVIDFERFHNTIARWVPKTNHKEIIYVTENTKHELTQAFFSNPPNERTQKESDKHLKVYFLLHGIRDSRDTFEEIKNCILEKDSNAKVVSPDYGYLSARQFLFSRYRDSFVPWFTDNYSQNLAKNPNASFYFAGHSNGTYILGEALKRIPNIQFERLYLAGTVLPRKYKWAERVKREQVIKIRSDMGNEDYPVGVLCYILNKFGWKKIGHAGTEGFEWQDSEHIAHNKFKGGHSVMLEKSNVLSIVDFLTSGTSFDLKDSINPPSSKFVILKQYGDVLLPVIIIVLSIIVFHFNNPILTISYFLLFLILWIVLDRF